mmetsp:Transcript_36911/g.76765  ORF Transcript_36911/g.76765 Transcript_36911/m.76765 type:complete len:90 (-) Transcript_36911:70-339(-)
MECCDGKGTGLGRVVDVDEGGRGDGRDGGGGGGRLLDSTDAGCGCVEKRREEVRVGSCRLIPESLSLCSLEGLTIQEVDAQVPKHLEAY